LFTLPRENQLTVDEQQKRRHERGRREVEVEVRRVRLPLLGVLSSHEPTSSFTQRTQSNLLVPDAEAEAPGDALHAVRDEIRRREGVVAKPGCLDLRLDRREVRALPANLRMKTLEQEDTEKTNCRDEQCRSTAGE
jgi:hypothetical protein